MKNIDKLLQVKNSHFSLLLSFCKEYLHYENGKLFWKKHWRRPELSWCEAGAKGRIGISGEYYATHKIIFMIHNGYYNNYIIRIDENKNNNKIENLQDNSAICKQPSVINRKYLRSILSYDEDTGIIRWRYTNPLKSSIRNGKIAGTTDNLGYKRIKLFGKVYFSHHLIWIYMNDEKCIIDHIDRNTSNNKFSNLRAVTNKLNARNRCTGKELPKSGHRGIINFENGSYGAFIGYEWLGTYKSLEEAMSVRKFNENKLGYII